MKVLVFALAVLMLAGATFAQEHSGLVFLVRHAEKESQEKNALLNKEGLQRAKCLSHLLAEAEIKKIFVTEVQRTQQTADPLAKILGFKPVVLNPYDIQGLISQLQANNTSNILVVAHSDTLPKILNALGAGQIPKISETEFDRMFVFHYNEGSKQGTVTLLRYCDCNP